MSGVKESENVCGAMGCVLRQRKDRSVVYSPSNSSAPQRKYRKNDSLPDSSWNFLPQTVSRKAYANRNPKRRELKPAVVSLLSDAMIAVLIPLKEFETCR